MQINDEIHDTELNINKIGAKDLAVGDMVLMCVVCITVMGLLWIWTEEYIVFEDTK